MGSLSKAAVAACIVLCGQYPLSIEAGIDDGFSIEPAGPCEVTPQTEFRHPSSRKYVAGPWPRFAKEMLA